MFKLKSKSDTETLTDLNGPKSCCATKKHSSKRVRMHLSTTTTITHLAHSRIKRSNKMFKTTTLTSQNLRSAILGLKGICNDSKCSEKN
jgi:hypothetical protein